MIESLRHPLSSLARHPQRWTSIVLAALIALELLRSALALVHPAPHGEAPQAGAIHLPPRNGADVQRIVSTHLFGVAAREADEDPEHAPETTASLALTGTIATQEPKQGLAIILDAGRSQLYKVGESVGGALLHSVYADHVILDRQGALETLRLPHALLAGHAARAPGGALALARLHLDTEGRVLDRELGAFERTVRTVGQYDGDTGKLRGVHLYPVPGGASLDTFGLSPGDLVTAVNGEKIDDSEGGSKALDALKRSGQGTVTLERQGRTMTVVLDLSSTAGESRTGGETPREPDQTAPST